MMRCRNCNTPTAGVELTHGAMSAICPTCYAGSAAKPAKPAAPKPAAPLKPKKGKPRRKPATNG